MGLTLAFICTATPSDLGYNTPSRRSSENASWNNASSESIRWRSLRRSWDRLSGREARSREPSKDNLVDVRVHDDTMIHSPTTTSRLSADDGLLWYNSSERTRPPSQLSNWRPTFKPESLSSTYGTRPVSLESAPLAESDGAAYGGVEDTTGLAWGGYDGRVYESVPPPWYRPHSAELSEPSVRPGPRYYMSEIAELLEPVE
jgi:hypothetical protein